MQIDLRQLLLTRQSQLAAGLNATRETLEHPGARGAATEFDWQQALSEFLPRRYQVSKAFVIDSEGNRSDEIDLVIHDRHFCPLLFERGGSIYIPAESVYAVFEIKPQLTRGTIYYAHEKTESVRRLHRTNGAIVDRGHKKRGRPELFPILAGILALSSSWKDPLGPRLVDALGQASPNQQLDLGCTILHGAFEADHAHNPLALDVSEAEAGLMFFYLRLFTHLQTMGTVSAIDLAAYGRHIEA